MSRSDVYLRFVFEILVASPFERWRIEVFVFFAEENRRRIESAFVFVERRSRSRIVVVEDGFWGGEEEESRG